MKFNLANTLEAYHRWKTAPEDKLFCSHFFISKPPNHWGYVISSGIRVLSETLQSFTVDQDFLNNIQAQLQDLGISQCNDFLDAIQNARKSWRLDAVHDGNFLFGSQPIICLQGNTFLSLILLNHFQDIIEQSVNTATRVSRLQTAVKQQDLMIKVKNETEARAALIGGAKAIINRSHQDRNIIMLSPESYQIASREESIIRLHPVAAEEENLNFLKNLTNPPKGIILPFNNCHKDIEFYRQKLIDFTWYKSDIYCQGTCDESALKKQVLNGAEPDFWFFDLDTPNSPQGAIQVQALKSAICDRESKWKWLESCAEKCAFPKIPGFLNIRRYGKRKPMGDMIVNEHIKASNAIINDREFLNKSLRGDFKILLEPVFMGMHFTLLQDEVADAKHAQLQKELFGKNYTTLDFPGAYSNGLEENFYHGLLK